MVLVNYNQSNLTEQQLQAIDLLVGRCDRILTKEEVAKEVGVSRQTIYNWMKQPEFRAELVKEARTITDSGLAKGLTWMEKSFDDPKVKDAVKVQMVKLFMQSQGMLKDIQETTITTNKDEVIDDLLEHYGIRKKPDKTE